MSHGKKQSENGAHKGTRIHPDWQLLDEQRPGAQLVQHRAMRDNARERVSFCLARLLPNARVSWMSVEARPGRMRVEEGERGRAGHPIGGESCDDVCGERQGVTCVDLAARKGLAMELLEGLYTKRRRCAGQREHRRRVEED